MVRKSVSLPGAMHQKLIQLITEEVRATITDRRLGKVLQLTPSSLVLDFGLRECFLFISVDPANPRFYLIKRRSKDLEKQATQLSPFAQAMRSKLSNAQLINLEKDPLDRVVRLTFRIQDECGEVLFRRLVIQITGRSANLFLLDELNRIVGAMRRPKGAGQQTGEAYFAPATQRNEAAEEFPALGGSPSAHADAYFTGIETAKAFESQANVLRSKFQKAIAQKRRLRTNLEKDLASHGNPEDHKRLGDLLLANVATAVREGNRVRIVDYYAEGSPIIELLIDQSISLQDEAARRFRQYAKGKRAGEEIAERLSLLAREIAELETRKHELEQIIEQRDENALESFDESEPGGRSNQTRSTEVPKIPGVRRYLSSDGYEILVGRGARDNDNLTFRLARPHDLWMHAGDYPGSHVVVRNPSRKEIPHRTIIEAAQLAGRFSQASEDSKVVVHYTQRKYLSKPKGSAPGLVRMSSFRSITVEPKEGIRRI